IHDQQDLDRRDRRTHPPELVHELRVDLQAPRSIEDQRTMTARTGTLQSRRRQLRYVTLATIRVDGHTDLLAERLELIDRGRAVDVQRRQKRALPFPRKAPRQLRSRRRLPRTLETDQQDHRRRDRGRGQTLALLAEKRDQLVVYDLDDLLTGRNGLEDLLAQSTRLDLRQEIACKLVVYVRLEQNTANLPKPILDHGLREQTALLESAEYAVQLFRKLLEHPARRLLPGIPKPLSILRSDARLKA